jgi:thiol-disulfide isomerase/thioredoxin
VIILLLRGIFMVPERTAIAGVTLIVVVIGLLVGVSLFVYQTSDNSNTTTNTTLIGITPDQDLLELGLKVPTDWSFAMSNGSYITLSDLSGKVILVDLMATWCSACASENTNLEGVYENLAGPLIILSLSVDVSETVSMLADYKSAHSLPWDHGLDSNSAFTNYFGVTSIPSLVLIDGKGYFRFFHVGLWSEASISDRVASIM